MAQPSGLTAIGMRVVGFMFTA